MFLCLKPFFIVVFVIEAAVARAGGPAELVVGEAFAVELKTLGALTVACLYLKGLTTAVSTVVYGD